MTVGYLLDTNVVSETRKVRANAGVTAFLSGIDSSLLFISALTIGELYKGIALKRRTDSKAADQLTVWVQNIEVLFANQILAIDQRITRLWGETTAQRSLPVIDTLIAATAITHNLTLITRNTKDMNVAGVTIIDLWR